MTSMERVMAVLQGSPVDRRAFTLLLSLYGAKLTGCNVHEYYTIPDNYLQGQIAVAEKCKTDILFTPFALSLEAQAFGSEVTYMEKNPPVIRKQFVRNLNEVDHIMDPDSLRSPSIGYLLDSSRMMVDHFGKTIPVCGILTSPMDLPFIIMGVENWLELLLFQKETAEKILSKMADHFVSVANSMFDAGIAFIGIPMMFSNPEFVFEKMIVEYIVPALSKIFRQVKGPLVFHHGSMRISRYLQYYTSLPNVAGFLIDHRDDFSSAREIVGKDTLLLGNLDAPRLGRMPTMVVLDRTRKILDTIKSDHHVIFATSAADVAWDTPLETITGIYELMEQSDG